MKIHLGPKTRFRKSGKNKTALWVKDGCLYLSHLGLPFLLHDYLELVDWTGRILREDKRGVINANLPPILERLAFDNKGWNTLTTRFETQFSHWVGQEKTVRKLYKNNKYQRIPSTKAYRALLG